MPCGPRAGSRLRFRVRPRRRARQRHFGQPGRVETIHLATVGPVNSQEFRAAYSATYQVKVSTNGGFNMAELYTDCRADAKTLCTLVPGNTKPGADTAVADRDWYQSNLQRGKVYTVTLAA